MTKAVVLGITPKAIPAWVALCSALDRLAGDGRAPVCEQRPDQWLDHRPAVRREAAAACTWCPAAPACRAFARANRERSGVWGGHDFTPNPATKGRAA